MSMGRNEVFVVTEAVLVWDDAGVSRQEERPVGVFFDESHAMAWCDQEAPRRLSWRPVPVLDA